MSWIVFLLEETNWGLLWSVYNKSNWILIWWFMYLKTIIYTCTFCIFPKGWGKRENEGHRNVYFQEKNNKNQEPVELLTYLGAEIVFGKPALISITLNLSWDMGAVHWYKN